MLFAFDGRTIRNFCSSWSCCTPSSLSTFVDRAGVAAGAGVIRKELDLSNIALGRCASTEA
jgi:hypothetical protein